MNVTAVMEVLVVADNVNAKTVVVNLTPVFIGEMKN
jgi:hypothetical protein